MYIYIYIKRTSKDMVWIKGPGPHAIHTPRSIPPSSVIFHDSLLCFCYVILFLSPCSMVLLLIIRLFDNQEKSCFSFHTPCHTRCIPDPYPKHVFATTSPCLT